MKENNYNQWLIEQLIDVQENERARISRDLHDSLSQELSMVKLYLDSLKNLKVDSPAYSKAISEMGSLITSAVGSVREISHDLSPHIIQSNDLCNALEILIGKCKIVSDIKVVFICHERIGLSDKKKELYIYRAVQEFIHNSLKHSEATEIIVELKRENEKLQILLSDNGKGFDITGEYNSIGLANIDMRMKLIGATYEYFSIPTKGTDLKISIDEERR
ncbi:MAG: signal transduction histidine kinase [Crocinitomicaceae bacterium]|jgi:signal transduction histidine kinase